MVEVEAEKVEQPIKKRLMKKRVVSDKENQMIWERTKPKGQQTESLAAPLTIN